MTTGPARPSRPVRVLVVEDSVPVRELVARSLASEGLVVDQAVDVREARARLEEEPPDVVVLDVVLPDGSGFDLLREIVAGGVAPVVMLSSRAEEIDRVLGLELGAEDYVVKPFFPRELTARVRRAASRGGAVGGDRPERPRRLDVGALVVDFDAREVLVGRRPVDLTGREFDLLAHLAASPRRVFSRDELLRDVWQSSAAWQKPTTVTEHVRRLRQKIEDDPARPRWIVTVAGAGYRLEPQAAPRYGTRAPAEH